MQVAVLSDCHDRLENLEKVLAKTEDAEVALFCGDYCAPFTLKMLAERFPGAVHSVFGNNDGDAFLLLTIAQKVGNVTFHQPMASLELDGRRVAVVHYPEFGEALALSGKYDAVFSGHSHVAQAETFGASLWANPGEVMGRFGKPTFGLYDTKTNTFEIHDI
jgi:hypothetical protein